MIILDTNIVSELMKNNPNQSVFNWFGELNSEIIAITSITIAEIQYGISVLPEGRRRAALNLAFKQMIAEDFKQCVVDFDKNAALKYGQLAAVIRSKGMTVSQSDTMIAAIVDTYDALLATRNTKDFQHFGIKIVNPFCS